MQLIRTLVLSGGGGRGAFHAGVYKYLANMGKDGVDINHQGAWEPDVVVGTSIGAVNGAAIVQGISAQELESFWLALREKDIQGLPPGMRALSKLIARRAIQQMIGVPLERVQEKDATSPIPEQYWPPLPFMPHWLAEKLVGRWINLLDTGPLRRTLSERLKINEQKIAHSVKTLLITATNVQTGERVIFSNRPVVSRSDGIPRKDVYEGITINRILASCSIPLVYPWTYDPGSQAFYWDGAVVSNTPLGGALDAVRDQPVEIPMEVVVVLMTPWWEAGEVAPTRARELPDSFSEAVTWTLDWALLASFRERLRLIDMFNQFAAFERETDSSRYQYRQVKVLIVSPDDFFPVARIIDYDEYSAKLIQLGYQAARKAFQKHFPV
jgi:NTE family protein